MKLIIIIAVTFVLLIPSPIFAPSHPEYVGFQTPLKQIMHGISAEDVKCNIGLELFIKNNGSPVCLKPTTLEILYRTVCKSINESSKTIISMSFYQIVFCIHTI
jgi:hypothetical protein